MTKRAQFTLSITQTLFIALSLVAANLALGGDRVSGPGKRVQPPSHSTNEVRHQIPDPPGGGGGGVTCVTNCTMCSWSCNDAGFCYPTCPYSDWDGGCGCNYEDYGQTCVDAGTCTYD